MTTLIVWACLLLVNGQGVGGISASTQEACETERQNALTHDEVLASTPCVQMTLEKKETTP